MPVQLREAAGLSADCILRDQAVLGRLKQAISNAESDIEERGRVTVAEAGTIETLHGGQAPGGYLAILTMFD